MSTSSGLLDVIVAGDLFTDVILSGFARWPLPGTEVFCETLHRELGGGAAIVASGLARLGSRAALFGVLGEDGRDWALPRLTRFGVDTSLLEFDPAELTAVTVVVSTAAERTFLTYHGPNRHFPEMLEAAAFSNKLTNFRHLHLNWAPNLDTAADLFAAIRRQGCSISLDVGWHEDWLADPRSLALLPSIDIFFPNEAEARRMTGESDCIRVLHGLAAAGARHVVLKLGADGAAMLWDGDILDVKPHRVTPIDTTGAGDCFNAGFLHYWLSEASPMTCLRAANFCGAASTEAHGGIDAFPAAERVRLELKNSYA
jgi:sugar/nucleoside kinase (ribokinase family)